MKRWLIILAFIIVPMLTTSAQSVRLGERIPKINVDSPLGKSLDYCEHDHIALIFIHSDSRPCIEALRNFEILSEHLKSDMSVVLLTTEDKANHDNIIARLPNRNREIAYDVEHSTFNAFGIDYVPFCVIYTKKRGRVVWFGPLTRIDNHISENHTEQ